MPTFRVEVLNPGQISMPANKRQSLPEYGWAAKLVLNKIIISYNTNSMHILDI